MANDVPLLCDMVPRSTNVALRSLGMALGLGGFMVGLSPRLALLALLEAPLIITARKVYDARYQVTVGTGWNGGEKMETRGMDGMGWQQQAGMGTGWW